MPDRHIQNIERELRLSGGSKVMYRKMDSHRMDMHCHDAVQVMIPLEQASFEISWSLETRDTETKMLAAGDLCIVPPFLEHGVRWISAHFVNIYLPTSFIYESTEHEYERDEQLFAEQIGIKDTFISQLGSVIRQHFLMHAHDNYKFFDGVLVVLSNYLLNNCTIDAAEANGFRSRDEILDERIRDAMVFLSEHLDRPVSVEVVAKQSGMSQYHFMRVFKEQVGASPARYHTYLRMEKAKQMLEQKRDIVDVAYDLGYSSQSHFGNVFAKTVGITTRKYLQQAQQS